MFGRKICLEYPGIRRECNNCYGTHSRKYCRSERCGMENFVRGFSNKYPRVPAELYGKLSHFLMPVTSENEPTDQLPDQTQSQSQPDLDSWTVARSKNHRKPQPKSNSPQQPQGGPQQQPKPQQPVQLQQQRVPPTNPIDRPVLKIMLTKGTDGNWLPNPQAAVKPTSLVVGPHDDVGTTVGVVATRAHS